MSRSHHPVRRPIRAGGHGTAAAADHPVLQLQRQAGNRAVSGLLQRKGMWDYGVDWIKGKFSGEESLDEQLKTGLERAATVFRAAEEASTLGGMTGESLARAKAYREAADAFGKAAENAGNIIKVKEYLGLFIEFKHALDEAEDVDLSVDGEDGARKLFALMAAGGKIGKKVFPPPFDAYFDFIAQIKNLENVARPWQPDRAGGPHSHMWDQIEGYRR